MPRSLAAEPEGATDRALASAPTHWTAWGRLLGVEEMAAGDFFVCILSLGRCKGPAFNLRTRPPCALRASGATRHLPGTPASRCGRSSPDLSHHRDRDGALALIDRRLRLIQTPGSGPIRADRP